MTETKRLGPAKMWKILFKNDVDEEPKIINDKLKNDIEIQVSQNKPFKIDGALFSPFSYTKITPYFESNKMIELLNKESAYIVKKVKESMKIDKKKLTRARLERMIEVAKGIDL